ncbi:unnamed protein product [Chrysodeixis includens]|uniref:Uncharacterized protein n=1 Tax=Chrysodeixis includens TaxID=689277 RepID=A0A9N8PYY7_CHRIL|nr:unnamed protein product [Chrysodeixis includens]
MHGTMARCRRINHSFAAVYVQMQSLPDSSATPVVYQIPKQRYCMFIRVRPILKARLESSRMSWRTRMGKSGQREMTRKLVFGSPLERSHTMQAVYNDTLTSSLQISFRVATRVNNVLKVPEGLLDATQHLFCSESTGSLEGRNVYYDIDVIKSVTSSSVA